MSHQRTCLIRTTGELRDLLKTGQVAFYLGAGVDKILTEDAGVKPPPGWQNLLQQLFFEEFTEAEICQLFTSKTEEGCNWNELFANWSYEIAALIHWKKGDINYYNQIDKLMDRDFEPNFGDNTTQQLCTLLAQSNLIFTTNYSEYIKKALITYDRLHNQGCPRNYVILDREDLGGFILPAPVPAEKIKTVFIVYIHGRRSSRSFPVLDAWGYNIAQFDDDTYLNALEALFKTRNVISLGTSWTDIPIRNVIGYLNRKYPYLGHNHLGIYFSTKLPKAIKTVSQKIDPQVSWTNAMNAIYGLNCVIVGSKDEQKQIIRNLNTSLEIPEGCSSLSKIADFLEETGDYESDLQHRWLVDLGHEKDPSTSEFEAAKIGVSTVVAQLEPTLASENLSEFVTALKIERHLRHHIYLYPPDGTNKSAAELRKKIWRLLYLKLPHDRTFFSPDHEDLLFNFLVGAFEVGGFSRRNFPNLPDQMLKSDLLIERLKIAENLWIPIDPPTDCSMLKYKLDMLEQLGMQLLEVGWESMAAKVFLDKAFLMAQGIVSLEEEPVDVEEPLFRNIDIINEAKRAEGIARVTGFFRRRIKCDVIGAIWNKNLQESRQRLLALLQLNDRSDSPTQIEPLLKNTIGIGLVVNQLCFEGLCSKSDKKDVEKIVEKTLQEAGLEKNDVLEKRNVDYWGRIVPKEIKMVYNMLPRIEE